jgi:hypothetical protein
VQEELHSVPNHLKDRDPDGDRSEFLNEQGENVRKFVGSGAEFRLKTNKYKRKGQNTQIRIYPHSSIHLVPRRVKKKESTKAKLFKRYCYPSTILRLRNASKLLYVVHDVLRTACSRSWNLHYR